MTAKGKMLKGGVTEGKKGLMDMYNSGVIGGEGHIRGLMVIEKIQ